MRSYEILTLDIITHRLTLVWWIFTKVGHDDEWTLLQMSFDVDLRVTFDLHIGVKYAFSLKNDIIGHSSAAA